MTFSLRPNSLCNYLDEVELEPIMEVLRFDFLHRDAANSLMTWEHATGKTHELLDLPELSEMQQYYYDAFCELHSMRTEMHPITLHTMVLYCEVCGVPNKLLFCSVIYNLDKQLMIMHSDKLQAKIENNKGDVDGG